MTRRHEMIPNSLNTCGTTRQTDPTIELVIPRMVDKLVCGLPSAKDSLDIAI